MPLSPVPPPPPSPPPGPAARALVLVGGGPASTSLLERLVANAGELAPDGPLDVHVVDPHPVGAGRLWRTTQSPEMRMNSMAEDVTMFVDGSVTCEGPAAPGPTLAAWAAEVGVEELDDPSLLGAVRDVRPTTFPDRRVQGEYLQWLWRRTTAAATGRLRVRTWAATAVELTDMPGGRQRVLLDDGTALLADAVVLALGHLPAAPSGPEADLAAAAQQAGLVYLPPSYTSDVDLSAVPEGEPVLVRGLGQGFVDLVVRLTEGRGGRFVPRPGGGLDYHPSGREPVLWAGSRRGLVHHCKTSYPLQGPRPALPQVLTAPVVAELAARGDLDLRRDVWPYVVAEVSWGYYHELAHAHPDRLTVAWSALDPLLRVVDPAGAAARDDLLARVVPDPADRLDLDALDRPLAGRTFPSYAEVDAEVAALTEADLFRRSDAAWSADLGAFLGLLAGFGAVHRLVQAGAFAPASQLADVDGWWRGLFLHLTSGPPPERVEQLLALHRADLLHFLGAGLALTVEDGRFLARTSSVPGATVTARTLVEAHLPRPHLRHGPGALVEGLYARGELAEEVLRDRDGRPHPTGLLQVDPVGRVVDATGAARPDRYALGPLTTARAAAAFARPGTDAPAFRAADAMARALLQTLAEPDRLAGVG